MRWMLVQVLMCQNGRSPDTDRSDTSQDSPERINDRTPVKLLRHV